MTALALAPDTGNSYEHAAAAGTDRAIRVSTAIAVLAVAGCFLVVRQVRSGRPGPAAVPQIRRYCPGQP